VHEDGLEIRHVIRLPDDAFGRRCTRRCGR
jgi:hypothetical protein